MQQPASGRITTPKSKRRTIWLSIVVAALAYTGATYYLIARQATKDETRPADVIVVFGAAEYAGRPSPAFRARLDHAADIYRKGFAPFIITTGGKGDAKFTEGGVGRDYLVTAGVPENKIIAETQSEDTSESAQRVSTIMRANGMRACVAVSDGYHIYRIKRMMGREGIEAFGSPRPGGTKRPFVFLREVASITLWRLHIT